MAELPSFLQCSCIIIIIIIISLFYHNHALSDYVIQLVSCASRDIWKEI